MHRYRDIDSNIRVSCIQSLGVWILSYPSLFLQDRYLKYLGWTLNDKVHSCTSKKNSGLAEGQFKLNALFLFDLKASLNSCSLFAFL